MLKTIIKRPVLATVISVILVILGLVGIQKLPITSFPEIAPPSVVVSATYPGASSEVIARSVAPPLENAINGVENMDYVTSSSSSGTLMITVVFKLGTDPDQAAVNVQNRVSQATSQLPAEVNQIGVTTMKRQNSMLALIALYGDDGKTDDVFIENYAKINIVPELKRIKGVGDAMVFGNKDYSMRVWLDPQKMTSYIITPQEVMRAIQTQNVEAAPGRFGERSKEALDYVIRYKGKNTEPAQYENMILRADNEGKTLSLKDIAKVEFSAYDYGITTLIDKKPGVVTALYQTAGSNANEIEIAVQKRLKELSASFPPGVKYKVTYSSKESLDMSIEQLIHTLIEAFILVFIVVYLFLQDFRSTLIPAIAVPVSIVGTFFFMSVLGFSINLLTLFALVLAIGIVVDDAIVVVEAVHAKMEHRKLNPRAATMSAMSEITGAIFSITLVMAAVFVPVAFMEGSIGIFYQQFALTLAIAIIISAINALTLSPALCAIFLKQHDSHSNHHEKLSFKDRFFVGFNASFDKMTFKYGKSVLFLLKNKWVAFSGLGIVIGLFAWMFTSTPTGFIPDEDQSFLMVTVTLPPGATKERTAQVIQQAEESLAKNPALDSKVSVTGLNMMNTSISSSSGVLFVKLKKIKERGNVQDLNQIIGELQAQLNGIKEASFFVLGVPTVPGFGTTSGMEIVLQDRTAGSFAKFNETSNAFTAALMQRPEIAMAFSTFNAGFPQYELVVDEVKATQLGVNVSDLMGTMQGYYGSMQASDFNRFGKYYRVLLQSSPEFRADPASINGIFIKNNLGEMVPINTLATLKKTQGPDVVDHHNLFNAINITALPAPGYSTGQAMAALKEVSEQSLPNGFTYDLKGMSREEQTSGGQSAVIFTLCFIFVYFILSAQYESYIVPFAVLLGIPTGLLGVFVGVSLGDLTNNIYVQVALVMLIGLLAKNAILIVEFAMQRRRAGKSLTASAVEAAKARLRPILMTSLAFIAGLLPLLFASGPSAIGNHSIGYAAVFGMLFGTVLGVFITPILFVVFKYLQERISGAPLEDNVWDYEPSKLKHQAH